MAKLSSFADTLWGSKAKLSYLMVAASLLLFTLLGGREIWTQEHRWADIVFGMFYRGDFLHPFLGEHRYYDKPLLSYWLIALVAKISGSLTPLALRLPSALAGLLAIWSIYRLGSKLKNRQLGLLSGWLLLTTFYFLFWARTSSADMLNLAGSLFAVAWYMDKRDQARFSDYAIFFIIVALTSLCKGLIGVIVPCIAVFMDVVLQKSWKRHLRPIVFLSIIPGLIIYLLPFLASAYFGGESYGQNGLYLVYRENILRYFQPFDHQGPIYTYFLYLPIYLLPWAIFFFPALWALMFRFKRMSVNSKWIVWTLVALFIFFTLSGSRRSYYVLPIVPFAILFIADWLQYAARTSLQRKWTMGVVGFSFLFLFMMVDVVPSFYNARFGLERFVASLLKAENKVNANAHWNVVLLDAEAKLSFYLQLPPAAKNYGVVGKREDQTTETLLKAWPLLTEKKPSDTIFITRKRYIPLVQSFFPDYRVVSAPSLTRFSFMKESELNAPVAFIPTKSLP